MCKINCLVSRQSVVLHPHINHTLPKHSSLVLDLGGLPRCQLLGDEKTGKTDGDDKDNAEHNNDTGLMASPVAALGDLGDGVASDDGGVDGRHCGIGLLLQSVRVRLSSFFPVQSSGLRRP